VDDRDTFTATEFDFKVVHGHHQPEASLCYADENKMPKEELTPFASLLCAVECN